MMTDKQMPLVSVAMTCYNEPLPWLKEALASIEAQTYPHFELVVVIDNPTYEYIDFLEAYGASHTWCRVLCNSANEGPALSMNKALAQGKGDFLAMMDADDRCTPNRLQRQVDFLLSHSEIDLCGTWMKRFGKRDRVVRFPEHQEDMTLYIDSCFARPSIMMRRRVFDDCRDGEFFKSAFTYAEDYEAWVRLYPKYRLYNIPEIHHYYRTTNIQVSRLKRKEQRDAAKVIRLRALNDFLVQKGINHQLVAPIQIKDVSFIASLSDLFPTTAHRELLYRMICSLISFAFSDYLTLRRKGIWQRLTLKQRWRIWKYRLTDRDEARF